MSFRGPSRRFVPLLVAAVYLTPTLAEAQFNPQGRKRPSAPATRPKGPASPPRQPSPAGTTQPSPTSPGETTTSETAISPEVLIERYTQAALSQPGAEFPLRRLAELARKRDGHLDRLLEDFEARAERARKEGRGQYAALIALGGLYEQAGRWQDAARAYGDAAQLDPKATLPLLAQARLLERQGNKSAAIELSRRVLDRVSGSERELLLRDLIRLCLDTKDFDGAKEHHKKLVQSTQGSFHARAELGRELLRRGYVTRAVAELREVAASARGDNRALAPALKDLGAALVSAGESQEAIDVLRKARAAAAGQPGLQRELDELSATAYRRAGKLPEFVVELERSAAGTPDRLRLLGRLYEETGEVDKALAAHRRALSRDPADVETRLKVVQLLELSGELEQAIAQYEELVRRNPGDAPIVLRYAELLLQRGEQSRAIGHLERLEQRVKDEDTWMLLTEFYERIGETDRANQVLTRLSRSTLRDPRHLIELGSRSWRDGKPEEAKRIWDRILTTEPDRARALVTLGEVYLDHDLTDEALTLLREAVSRKPSDLRIQRSLAIALERVGAASSPRDRTTRFGEAGSVWEQVLAAAARDDSAHSQALAREARQHIVKLWQRLGQLSTRLSPLAARLAASPPDLDAGRLLAEAELHLRKYEDAEKTLRRVVEAVPGDVSSLLLLERSLVAQDKRDEAIEVLGKLTVADPQKARDYYQRSAHYAAEQYQDERAIEFAVRAVELNPDDAEGQKRLGDMYRRRGATDRAIASYRQAIAKNDRLYLAYFDLAELLIGQGRDEEADRGLRYVMRSAPDDELVARAARASLQLNLPRGSLEELEADLLPLALGRPHKPLYRRLLLEVYGAQAFPLVHRARSTDPKEREAARERLARLGERAVKPLLDALSDPQIDQQRTALELLTHVHAPGAAPALLAYAASEAPLELRERAVIAAGTASDERSLPRLESLVFEAGHAKLDGVAVAAAWAIARLPDRSAGAARKRLLETNVPELRTLGLLGNLRAALASKSAKAATRRELERALMASDAGPWPRAAAAYGLGLLVEPNGPEAHHLVGLLDSGDPLLWAHVLSALAALEQPTAETALAEALTSAEPRARTFALRAASLYANPDEPRAPRDPLAPSAEGSTEVKSLLEGLLPKGLSPTGLAHALIRLRGPLEESALLAIQSSGPRAVIVAQALTARDGAPAFGALTEHLDQVSPALRDEAERAALSITRRVASAYLPLLAHDSADVRSASVAVLGLLPDDERALSALLEALDDSAPEVQSAALTALGRSAHSRAPAELIRLLEGSSDWRLRRGAAEALGQKLRRSSSASSEVKAALERAAKHDSLAVVREAAAQALDGK